MKILVIHNFAQEYNGEGAYVTSLIKLFRSYGHQVVLFIKDSKSLPTSLLQNISIAVNMFQSNKIRIELNKVISDAKPDVAHIHNIYPLITPVIYLLLKQKGIPIVQTVHNYRPVCSKGILFKNGKICELCINKKFTYPSIYYGCFHHSRSASLMYSLSDLYQKAQKRYSPIDFFVFISKFSKSYITNNNIRNVSSSAIIPNFIRSKNKKVLKNFGKYFLFIGRLSEEKGILQLLEIFVTNPAVRLIVIGDGPLREKVEVLRKFKNIEFIGFMPHEKINAYLQNALCTIIPSLFYETGPLVLIESYASGTPVIVPRFGSFIQQVQNGGTGLFYRQNDFNDLKEKILYAWENKDKMMQMGISARKEYERNYTPEKHYKALMKVYNKLVAS